MRRSTLVLAAAYLLLDAVIAARAAAVLIGWLSTYLPGVTVLYAPLFLVLASMGGLALLGRTQAALLPVVYWAAIVSITSTPQPALLLLTLASYPLALAYNSGPGAGASGGSLLGALPIPLGIAALGAAIVYGAYRLYMLLPDTLLPRAGGDLPAMYRVVGGTLAFRLLALAVTLYILYRAFEHLLGLVMARLYRPPSLWRLERLGEMEGLRSLLTMRGRQYPVLQWAQGFMWSTLLAPLFLPVTRILVYQALPSLGRYATPSYIALGYILGWLFNRIINASLTSHPPLDRLREPPPPLGPRMLLAFSAAGSIIILYAAAGGAPETPILEALTGRPLAPDPLARALGIESLEKSVLSMAELLRSLVEAAVRFLWGG